MLDVIKIDWPPCNPSCEYEDPHGGIHDCRSKTCSCDAAKASIEKQLKVKMADTTKQTDRCNCETCRPNSILDPEGMRMILCSLCRNKRCPHATDHRNPCTNSNDVGQVGSSYEKAWNPSADLVKPIQAEPVAWMNPKNGVVIDVKRKLQIGEGDGYPKFNVPLYQNPAPALTAELKTELLYALRKVLAVWINEIDPDEYAETEKNLRAVIAKVEAIPVTESES